MKKIILAILFLTSLSAFSQQYAWDKPLDDNATTLKEYNYLTKGLKIQLESGLDVIAGYTLQRLHNEKIGNYNFEVKALIYQQSNKCKAISVVITSTVSVKSYYICIPQSNTQLTLAYWDSINYLDESLSKSYGYIMSRLYTNLLTQSK